LRWGFDSPTLIQELTRMKLSLGLTKTPWLQYFKSLPDDNGFRKLVTQTVTSKETTRKICMSLLQAAIQRVCPGSDLLPKGKKRSLAKSKQNQCFRTGAYQLTTWSNAISMQHLKVRLFRYFRIPPFDRFRMAHHLLLGQCLLVVSASESSRDKRTVDTFSK